MRVKDKTVWIILLSVLGEFFIIMDAGFIGYSMEHGIKYALEKYVFWIFLFLGAGFRYWAEKLKD